MSRSIASFVLAIAIGMLAGSAAAQAPAPDALLAEAQEFSKHGQYEQAIAAAEKALAAAEKSFGPEHPLVAKLLRALAGYYELKGEPAKALPLYRRALAIAEKSPKPDGSEVAELKARIADAEKKYGSWNRKCREKYRREARAPDEPRRARLEWRTPRLRHNTTPGAQPKLRAASAR